MIKKLDWDSEFFGIEVGEIIYSNEKNIDNCYNYDLLYVKSNSDFELEINNFKNTFSETKIIFSKEIINSSPEQESVVSLTSLTYDINDIYKLAFESGNFSRFKLDTFFEKKKFEELYKKWVDNSISNIFADDILIFKQDEAIVGFVSYKINENIAIIGLIAVHPEQQGKGIGAKLLNKVETIIFNKNITKLLIPTQKENTLACDFYTKRGYKIHETTYIKHFWKK